MSAGFMTITMRNKKIDNMKMYRSAMILNRVETDTSKYNQMSGKNMTGSFEEGALTRLLVEGNARTIYYVPEDSLQTLGINYAENSRSILHFENNDLKRVELLKDVDQVTYPEGDPEAVTRLLGFHWRGNERPLDKEDIFRVVEPSAPPPPPESAAPGALQSGGTRLRPEGFEEPEEPENTNSAGDAEGAGNVEGIEKTEETETPEVIPAGQEGPEDPAGQKEPADQKEDVL